jgi:hypothetical protein
MATLHRHSPVCLHPPLPYSDPRSPPISPVVWPIPHLVHQNNLLRFLLPLLAPLGESKKNIRVESFPIPADTIMGCFSLIPILITFFGCHPKKEIPQSGTSSEKSPLTERKLTAFGFFAGYPLSEDSVKASRRSEAGKKQIRKKTYHSRTA